MQRMRMMRVLLGVHCVDPEIKPHNGRITEQTIVV